MLWIDFVICRPGVSGMKMGAGSENGFALVWQVGDIGELMAVELEDGAEGGLLAPLTAQAVRNIVHILVEHIDLGLVAQGGTSVVVNFGGIGLNLVRVLLVVPLGLGDSLGELQDLKSEGLDGDDLIGVDINLLLVAVLISEWGIQVEVVDGVLVVLWNNGAIVALLSSGFSSGLSFDLSLSFDLGSGISAEVNSLSGECKGGKSSEEFH